MLKKVFTLALAVVFVTSTAAFACGGDKNASKTAEVRKTSSQTTDCSTGDAVMQTAQSNTGDASECPYVKAAQTASADNSENVEVKNAAYSSEKAPDACVAGVSKANLPACCGKTGDVSKTASENQAEKTNAEKTVMVEKTNPSEKL